MLEIIAALAVMKFVIWKQIGSTWSLLAAGTFLMACLQIIELINFVKDAQPDATVYLAAVLSSLVSVLWVAGMALLIPYFRKANQTEEAHSLLVEGALQGLVIYQNRRIVFANSTFLQLAGWTIEDIKGYGDAELESLFLPEEGDHPLVYFHNFPEDLSYIRQEVRMVSKDGVIQWVDIFISRTTYLEQPAIQATLVNITEERKYQQALFVSEQRHRLVSSMISDYVYSAKLTPTGDLQIEWISGAFERICGYSLVQIQAAHTGWLSFVYPEDLFLIQDVLQRLPEEHSIVMEYRIITASGQYVWLRDYVQIIHSDQKSEGCHQVLGAVQDITPQKQAEQALKKSESMWRSLVENAPAIITTLNREGVVLSINRSSSHRPVEQIIGTSIFSLLNTPEVMKTREVLEAVFTTGHPAELELQLNGPDGETIWYQNHAGPIWEDQAIHAIVVLSTDISERKRVEEKLRFYSTHDTLTGLYNRAFFESEIERLQSGRQYPVTIVIADVNGLKITNDQNGHAMGDELLRCVAAVLKESFRAEDVIARFGGDEFAVVLAKTDEHAASTALERLRRHVVTFNQQRDLEHHPFLLSIAAGFATGESGDSLDVLMKLADDHMYTDKMRQKSMSPLK
jgi:diguanylate cyclase (GGDEF)-like protein/PAS domain S-box-containing protein